MTTNETVFADDFSFLDDDLDLELKPPPPPMVDDNIFGVPDDGSNIEILSEQAEAAELSSEIPLKGSRSEKNESTEAVGDASRFIHWLGLDPFNYSYMVDGQTGLRGGTERPERADDLAAMSVESDSVVGVWVGINPAIDPMISKVKLGNADISRRLHLVFDLDPNNKDSPPDNKLEALAKLDEFLACLGFAARINVDSGNGGLILVKVDLPVKDYTDGPKGYIQRLYDGLNEALRRAGFDWHVDQACKDACRIVGLPGSMNRKPGFKPVMRSILGEPTVGEPMSEADFKQLIERMPSRDKTRVAPPPPAQADRQSSDAVALGSSSDFRRRLLWAMLCEEFGNEDIERTRNMLSEGGFEIIDDDGEGVFIVSPYADQYSTPQSDTDVKVYPSMRVAAFHESDKQLDWDGYEGFAQEFLPQFWSKFEARLAEREEEWERSRSGRLSSPSEYFEPMDSSPPLADADSLTDDELAEIMDQSSTHRKVELSADAFGPELCNIVDTVLDEMNYKGIGGATLFCLMPTLGMLLGKRLLIREKRFDMAKGSFRYANSTVIYNDKTAGAKTKAIEALLDPQYGEIAWFSAGRNVIELGNSMNDVVERCGHLISKRSKDAAEQKFEAEQACRDSMDGFLINADDDIEGFGKLSGNRDWSTKKQHLNILTSGADLSLPNKDFFRIYLDSCVSMIVSGQPERLSQEFPFDSKNIDSGLAGRCVYFSGGFPYEYVEGRGDQARKEAVYRRIGAIRSHNGFVEVTFDNIDVSGIFGNRRESYQRFARLHPDIAEKFRAKFRDIAAVWAGIRAVCEKDVVDPSRSTPSPLIYQFEDDETPPASGHNGKRIMATIDASEYFFGFYDLLFDSLLNYYIDISDADPFAQMQRQILLDFYGRPKGVMAKSDLQKKHGNGRRYNEFANVMQFLEDKSLVETRATSGKGKKYVELTDRGRRAIERMYEDIDVPVDGD